MRVLHLLSECLLEWLCAQTTLHTLVQTWTDFPKSFFYADEEFSADSVKGSKQPHSRTSPRICGVFLTSCGCFFVPFKAKTCQFSAAVALTAGIYDWFEHRKAANHLQLKKKHKVVFANWIMWKSSDEPRNKE